ncbi:hypothetical protein [Sinorhizobium meliloti]|uniref:hypothetical protein n=1 Tax=Rhizobium meliloti TaxID=382 RepID=UPI000FDC282A|nr:hypothetical protein [Sinorhizobium meliloti]RVG81316.1 hypothetical protein CN219_23710 [Sinorhizobium meliloti]RVI36934.1 hypothetical protein CN197_10265 [Sinorhizobium meliloti]RVI47084.1 hypothetical protein CN196_08275 [Sinorhizobium meliloti]RVJ23880.1 hypothetical protein CN177_17055 [Sinorhizobium meliloti]RVJ94823.1 hypothetical protein CN170_22360 [Sinorhizobium meliloti]
MRRPVSYACDPAQRYCECGHCALPPARNIDLEAVANLNRATTVTATFFILLATLLGLMAVGLLRTEGAMQRAAIINQENIVITKGPTSWH